MIVKEKRESKRSKKIGLIIEEDKEREVGVEGRDSKREEGE